MLKKDKLILEKLVTKYGNELNAYLNESVKDLKYIGNVKRNIISVVKDLEKSIETMNSIIPDLSGDRDYVYRTTSILNDLYRLHDELFDIYNELYDATNK